MVCWRQLRAWKPLTKESDPRKGMSCRSSRSTSHFNKQERPMLASRAAQQLDTSHQNTRRGERHEQKHF